MSSPRFSFIIPTLNEEKFLPSLLTSLVNQTEKLFEVIVVDGKSKDKTVAVAESFKKKLHLRVIVCERANLPMQRNRGASAARGEWLVFVDADSVLLPYFFERIQFFISTHQPRVFTTWFRPDSDVTQDAAVTLLGNLMIEGSLLLRRPQTPGPLTCILSSVFHDVGGYDESRSFGEDVDLGLRLARGGVLLSVLRETLFVWSLRRFRSEGALRVIQTYVRAIVSVLVMKKPPRSVPGYVMGGQLYSRRRRPMKRSMVKLFERKMKKLIKEALE